MERRSTTVFKNLEEKKPYLDYFEVWKCRDWVYIPKEKRKKLDEKSYQGIHLGYECTNQYRVYNLQTGQISVIWDLYLDEMKLSLGSDRPVSLTEPHKIFLINFTFIFLKHHQPNYIYAFYS